MKKYWKQIVGALILVLVLILINKATNDRYLGVVDDKDRKEIVNPNTMIGEVTAIFEGEHKLNYELILAEGATTSLSKNNRLLTIKGASSTSPVYFYFSYEGGRGYSAADYINNNIAPNTNLVKRETMQHGDNNWSIVRSANSSWHVGSFGEWLVVIENNNLDKELATKYIESFKVIKNSDTNAESGSVMNKDAMKDADMMKKDAEMKTDMKMKSTSTYEMN